MQKFYNKFVFLILGLILLYIDILSPLGAADWILYLAAIYIYSRYAPKNDIIIVTTGYIIFNLIGLYFSPHAPLPLFYPYINRTLSMILLITITFLSFKERQITRLNSETLDRVKDYFIDLDKNFRIRFVNKAVYKKTKRKDSLVGKSIYAVIPEAFPLKEIIKESMETLTWKHFEHEFFEAGVVIDISVYPSYDGVSIIGRDISEIVKSEKIVKKMLKEKESLLKEKETLLKEKETLLKEVTHRTKNNLQLILSLVNLQINMSDDEKCKVVLNETLSRIMSISLLQEKLHYEGGIQVISMEFFIKDIIERLSKATNYNRYFEKEILINDINIDVKSAIPIGLIINELLTNSMKYAFTSDDNNKVTIAMNFVNDDTLFLQYKDNGIGLPNGFDFTKGTGLGCSIINAFVEQLNGELSYGSNGGAEFKITLKVKKEQSYLENL